MMIFYTSLFLVFAAPLVAGMMMFAQALSTDSAVKERILHRQYAEASCRSWASAYEAGQTISPGSAEVNGYVVEWTEGACGVTESP